MLHFEGMEECEPDAKKKTGRGGRFIGNYEYDYNVVEECEPDAFVGPPSHFIPGSPVSKKKTGRGGRFIGNYEYDYNVVEECEPDAFVGPPSHFIPGSPVSKKKTGRGGRFIGNYEYDYNVVEECEPDAFVGPPSHFIPGSPVSKKKTGRGLRGQSDDTSWRTCGGASRDDRPNFKQESSNKKNITVPSDKVGHIVGKGGRKIRDLEYESKTKIKIGNSSRNETTIILFGSPEAILKVEGMINKLLRIRGFQSCS